MSESRKKSVFVQIFIGVAVAFLVGGTSPWWWEKIFGRQESSDIVREEELGTNDFHDWNLPSGPNIPPRDNESSTGKFVTIGFNARLFRGPDLFEPVIDYLPRNKRFRVMREYRKGVHVWFEIAYENKTGWVPAMSVTLEY